MIVHIQGDKIPHHFDAACVLYGTLDLNLNYRLVTYEQVMSGELDRFINDNLFVGTVEFMTGVFDRVGIVPERLPNSDRPVEIMTAGQAISRVEQGETLFIKPVQLKLFTGMVFKREYLSILHRVPEDTQVMVEPPFSGGILSEWRMYIMGGKVKYIANYSGDVGIFPVRFESVMEHVRELSEKFISFTCDVAVMCDGSLKIVEFNDMWAIGNYGVPNDEYLSMLKKRYFQIIKLKRELK
jgi:hypothetical protein